MTIIAIWFSNEYVLESQTGMPCIFVQAWALGVAHMGVVELFALRVTHRGQWMLGGV